MPQENNFIHSKYSRADPGSRVTYLTLNAGPPVNSPEWKESMAQAGEILHKAGVAAVLFVYGSHLGSDLYGSARLDEAGGLKRGYSRGIPGLESLLSLLKPEAHYPEMTDERLCPPFQDQDDTKTSLDALVGDTANISAEYLMNFTEGVNQALPRPIPCQRYLWSSLHHHLGRTEGALALFDYLQSMATNLSLDSGRKILILAYGHAGLVLALLSNFLAPEEASVRQTIFEILETYYKDHHPSSPALSSLHQLRDVLKKQGPKNYPTLDVVTFGTPIRYGWDTDGITNLLHWANHRPIRQDKKDWLAKMEFPQVAWELSTAVGGDYVQQLAVAGTDAVPSSPHEQEINQTLHELLEPFDGFERWLECARRATRCHNDGQCLLVDFQDASQDPPNRHLYGHACYTRQSGMLFQIQEIIKHLYSTSPREG